MVKESSCPLALKKLDFTSNFASVRLVKARNHWAGKYTPNLAKKYGKMNETTYRNEFIVPDQDKLRSFNSNSNYMCTVC